MDIHYKPIGTVHTPFKDLAAIPRQSSSSGVGIEGSIELFPEFVEGVYRLEEFSHLILLCHFHQARPHHLLMTPPGASQTRGLFASRSPNRPNPIGLSIVRLIRIDKNILFISDLDILDGTPLLDIKPFYPGLEPDQAETMTSS